MRFTIFPCLDSCKSILVTTKHVPVLSLGDSTAFDIYMQINRQLLITWLNVLNDINVCYIAAVVFIYVLRNCPCLFGKLNIQNIRHFLKIACH